LKRVVADRTLEADFFKGAGINQLWVAGIAYIRLHREFV
jgi:hypothetical protein